MFHRVGHALLRTYYLYTQLRAGHDMNLLVDRIHQILSNKSYYPKCYPHKRSCLMGWYSNWSKETSRHSNYPTLILLYYDIYVLIICRSSKIVYTILSLTNFSFILPLLLLPWRSLSLYHHRLSSIKTVA